MAQIVEAEVCNRSHLHRSTELILPKGPKGNAAICGKLTGRPTEKSCSVRRERPGYGQKNCNSVNATMRWTRSGNETRRS
jgi:hypothetical protein